MLPATGTGIDSGRMGIVSRKQTMCSLYSYLVFQVLVSPFYTPYQVADVMESTMHTQV